MARHNVFYEYHPVLSAARWGHPESHPACQYHAIFATEPAPVETDLVSEIVKIDSWGSLSPMPLTLDREKSG
jgi:hypothetical protein